MAEILFIVPPEHISYTDVTYARLVETGKKYYFDDAHAEQVTRLAKIFYCLRVSPVKPVSQP